MEEYLNYNHLVEQDGYEVLPRESFQLITHFHVPDIVENRYLLSIFGRFYDLELKRFKAITMSRDKSHYPSISYRTIYNTTKNFRFHRLLMLVFRPIPNPELYDVNHIDGNKNNFNIISTLEDPGNLEWCTRQYNIKHAYDNNLSHVNNRKISEETAKQIVSYLCENKYTNKEIAEMVGNNANEHIVADIKKKKDWKYLTTDYDFYQRKRRLFTEQDIHNICKCFQDYPKNPDICVNDYCRSILEFLGYDVNEANVESLRKIFVRKHYVKISSNYNF